ncbi:MAG: alpha/beta hydrolase, partial [Thauera sp.]
PVKPPKRRYWVDTAHRSDKAAHWRERAEARFGSWWEDWMAWLQPRAGARIPARPASDERYPSLAAAPGSYVLER